MSRHRYHQEKFDKNLTGLFQISRYAGLKNAALFIAENNALSLAERLF